MPSHISAICCHRLGLNFFYDPSYTIHHYIHISMTSFILMMNSCDKGEDVYKVFGFRNFKAISVILLSNTLQLLQVSLLLKKTFTS